jgi:predicted nucleic acid-binding protein
VIVSDTGPILHLSEAAALPLLGLAGDVHIPPAVEAELRQLIATWQRERPAWIRLGDLPPAREAQAAAWRQAGLLDYGEAEAVALSLELNPEWFLTDDAAARLFGEALGLEVHGSLGVVLWAAALGHTNQQESEGALERLARSSLWISQRVLQEATDALKLIFGAPNEDRSG